MEQDFLDEMIEESTQKTPEFPALMEEARQRRALLNDLVALRSHSQISQSVGWCHEGSDSGVACCNVDPLV